MAGVDLTGPAGLLALAALPGIGAAKARSLAQAGTLDGVDTDALIAAYGWAVRLVSAHGEHRVRAVGYFDEDYPQRLRAVAGAPSVLWVRGDVRLLSRRRLLAVAGTRQPTVFGESATELCVEHAARGGFGVLSGLALGVDAVAHRAALHHGVPTVAVLGGGLDNVTPPQHRALARDLLACGGALVSEQPFGTRPSPGTLVARNRLISAIGAALLVAQTPLASGTMHTARFAAAQGRAVFCPAGAGDHERSAGLAALLNTPARDLPRVVPAFATAARDLAALGDRPLARPVTRAGLGAWVTELQALAT